MACKTLYNLQVRNYRAICSKWDQMTNSAQWNWEKLANAAPRVGL